MMETVIGIMWKVELVIVLTWAFISILELIDANSYEDFKENFLYVSKLFGLLALLPISIPYIIVKRSIFLYKNYKKNKKEKK
jgi:cbb3-type cytochrome oxidase subunit 1